MNNNDISTLVDPPDHLLRVKCRARFPREHIINFAFASVGRFTLVLDSDRKILRANARLHDATYKYLVVDDPQILEAFAEGRDSEQYLSFPPLTKFRLDPFDEPDSNDSDASRPETARLVDVSNLPIMVVFGRRPIASLEPPKGAVNARLEAIWGKDVGHPISGLKKAEIYHKPLIDTAPVRRPVYRRVASPPDAMSRSSNRGLTILTLYAEQSSPLESECVAEIGRDTSRDTVPACEPGLGCSVPGHQCRDRNNYTTCKLHRRLVTLHQQMEKGGYQMLPSDSEAAGAGEKISTKRNNTSMEPRSTSGAFALATLEGLAAASNALREILSESHEAGELHPKFVEQPQNVAEQYSQHEAAGAQLKDRNWRIPDQNCVIARDFNIQRGSVLQNPDDVCCCLPAEQSLSILSTGNDRGADLARSRLSLDNVDEQNTRLVSMSAFNGLTGLTNGVNLGDGNVSVGLDSMESVLQKATAGARSSSSSGLKRMTESTNISTQLSRNLTWRMHQATSSNVVSDKSSRRGPKRFWYDDMHEIGRKSLATDIECS